MEKDWSDNYKRLFSHLREAIVPPKDIEEQTVKMLIKEKLIKKRAINKTYTLLIVSIAASVMLFLAGVFFGNLNSKKPPVDTSKGYMMLLTEDNDFLEDNDEVMFNEHLKWMTDVQSEGIMINGQEFKRQTILLNHSVNKTSKGTNCRTTTGYFIIQDVSLEKVVQAAEKNPHLKYGGSIEIKTFLIR